MVEQKKQAPNKKLLEAAKKYLYAHAIWVQTDCFDSYTSQNNWRHTYEFLHADDRSIEQFIHDHLEDEIQLAKDDFTNSMGEPWNDKPPVSQFLDEPH